MSFVHLHVHSEYSLLDGAARVPELARRARDLKLPALALTDHGNLHGAVEFHDACLKNGVKPILGMEAYVAPGSRLEKASRHGMKEAGHHLILLARDLEGWRNLIELSTIGYLQGFYYKPRLDHEVLARHARGLIALSACLGGEIPSLLLKGEEDPARERLRLYQEIFGKENFYLELQDHGIPAQKAVNKALVQLAKESGAGLVATNDSHYLEAAHAEAHDVLLCLQTGHHVEDADRLKFEGEQFYLKSAAEMERLFAEVPEALRNTVEIANRCHFELEKPKLAMPDFPLPKGHADAYGYLEALCRRALPAKAPGKEGEERLERELAVIKRLGFSGYFLTVADFIGWARSKGIRVGPGRGSAAGSLVSHLLGITSLNPLKHGLLFERFLNPDRVSPPDIDVDFADDRRDEVIAYVQEKYGSDKVAPIITFGTLGARAVLRDAGRALNFPYGEVDAIARLVPPGLDMTLHKALDHAEFKAACSEGRGARLLAISLQLEGLVRNASKHAAGIVVSPDPLIQRVPLCLDKSPSTGAEGPGSGQAVITQFDMASIERVGLIKIDFLGLRTLRVIEGALRLLGDRAPDLENLPDADPETFDMLSRGEAHGVFQLESSGMRDLLKRFRPRHCEDLDQLIALYRPGPMENIGDYLEHREGRKKPSYLHPAMEPVLRNTFGTIVYQEQVMRLAMEIGGLSAGAADLMRRAMSKKVPELLEKHRKEFVEGAGHKGLKPDKAEELFDLLAKFADYGFNKAHSASYALLAYQCAWLKRRHAPEFLCSVLSSESGNLDKVVETLSECRRLGIKVLPPDVNESGPDFTLSQGNIRFGLAAIKHVGEAAMQGLQEEREKGGKFKDLRDLLGRVGSAVQARTAESLIKAGALDSVEGGPGRRATLMAGLPQWLEASSREHADLASGQVSLFDGVGAGAAPTVVEAPAWNDAVKLSFEKEVLGYYVSGHPLQAHEALMQGLGCLSFKSLKELRDGEPCLCAGLVIGVKQQTTRRGEPFGRAACEDFSGLGEALVWPRAFKASSPLLKKDAALAFYGRVDLSGDEAKVSVEAVSPIGLAALRFGKRLLVTLKSSEESSAEAMAAWMKAFPGKTPLILDIETPAGLARQKPKAGISLEEKALAELEKALPGKWKVDWKGD